MQHMLGVAFRIRTQVHNQTKGLCYNYLYMAKAVKQSKSSSFSIEFDREDDGRWIAEIPKLPGVMAYGKTKRDALQRVYAIALRTLADTIESGSTPAIISRLFQYEVASR